MKFITIGETEKERESKVLMEVSLRIRDDDECEELSTQFAVAFNISTQLCAGKRGGDTCHGDSGKFTIPVTSINHS